MFELYRSKKSKEYYFRLKAANGLTILASEGYSDKTNCKKGIRSVKTNAIKDKNFEIKVARNGKRFFNLIATNGQVIGSSQMYASRSGLRKGIRSVQKNAPISEMKELD